MSSWCQNNRKLLKKRLKIKKHKLDKHFSALVSRRIDHYVRIVDIKNENPHATWSVRYWSFYRV